MLYFHEVLTPKDQSLILRIVFRVIIWGRGCFWWAFFCLVELTRRRGPEDEMAGWHHQLNGYEFE